LEFFLCESKSGRRLLAESRRSSRLDSVNDSVEVKLLRSRFDEFDSLVKGERETSLDVPECPLDIGSPDVGVVRSRVRLERRKFGKESVVVSVGLSKSDLNVSRKCRVVECEQRLSGSERVNLTGIFEASNRLRRGRRRDTDSFQLVEEVSPGSTFPFNQVLDPLFPSFLRSERLVAKVFRRRDDFAREVLEQFGGVLSDDRSELARGEGAESLVSLIELSQMRLRGRFEDGRESWERNFGRKGKRVGAPAQSASKRRVSISYDEEPETREDSRVRNTLFGFRRSEEITCGLLKNRSKFANTLVELVVGSYSTSSEGVDVDVFPTRELDEVLHVLLDSTAFGREERLDSSGVLRVEGVDVEENTRDLADRRSSDGSEAL
jgi:hypothetical protein